MKPRGPLMIEHRLIEKMIAIIRDRTATMRRQNQADPVFIDTAVDFIRTYADRTHHGKEEDILFKILADKRMSASDTRMMQILVDDHKYGRKTVAELVEAKEQYLQGDTQALTVILDKLNALADFYPEHIRKEDEEFFPNSEAYLAEDEQNKMLQSFYEFDQHMIHEKYKMVVDQFSIQMGSQQVT